MKYQPAIQCTKCERVLYNTYPPLICPYCGSVLGLYSQDEHENIKYIAHNSRPVIAKRVFFKDKIVCYL